MRQILSVKCHKKCRKKMRHSVNKIQASHCEDGIARNGKKKLPTPSALWVRVE